MDPSAPSDEPTGAPATGHGAGTSADGHGSGAGARRRHRSPAEARSTAKQLGYRLWVGGPVPRGSDAITIGKLVIARRGAAERPSFDRLLRHELTHVEQWAQLGPLRFLRRYLGEYVTARRAGASHRQAYLDISLEREARARAEGSASPVAAVTWLDVADSHREVEAFLARLGAATMREPSALPEWTRGHVVAHLIGNAEAFIRVGTALHNGSPAVMYDSTEARNAAIEERSGLPAATLAGMFAAANAELERTWAKVPGLATEHGTVSAVPGGEPYPASDVVFRRLREVEVHASDIGDRRYTYESWSDEFVDAQLRQSWPRLPERTTSGVHLIDERGVHHTTPGATRAPATRVTRRGIVAWLLNRPVGSELPALSPW